MRVNPLGQPLPVPGAQGPPSTPVHGNPALGEWMRRRRPGADAAGLLGLRPVRRSQIRSLRISPALRKERCKSGCQTAPDNQRERQRGVRIAGRPAARPPTSSGPIWESACRSLVGGGRPPRALGWHGVTPAAEGELGHFFQEVLFSDRDGCWKGDSLSMRLSGRRRSLPSSRGDVENLPKTSASGDACPGFPEQLERSQIPCGLGKCCGASGVGDVD